MKKFLKLLALSVFSFFAVTTAKAQCADPCTMLFRNEIDCQVQMKITWSCAGGPTQTGFLPLPPGSSGSPSFTNFPAAFFNGCPCASITIISIEVNSINGCIPVGGPVVLGPGTATINQPPLCGCCPVNFGTWTGCLVRTWMSCP